MGQQISQLPPNKKLCSEIGGISDDRGTFVVFDVSSVFSDIPLKQLLEMHRLRPPPAPRVNEPNPIQEAIVCGC